MEGPYEIATDDVQESQRRLKRRFRIVLENFLGIPYAGERGGTRGQAGINIYHTRACAVSYAGLCGIDIYHTRVGSVRRGLC